MRSRATTTTLLAIMTLATSAWGGGLDSDVIGARAIGRAGASLVSEDGAIALLVNPSGLARRGQLRMQVGTALHDDDGEYRTDRTDSATITDRARPVSAPLIGLQGALGPVVLGAAYVQTGDLAHRLPSPEFNQPGDEITTLFPHRYGGTSMSYQRHSVAIGGALRATNWLGVGAALSASWVGVDERRWIWSGFADRDGAPGNPSRDLELNISGDDYFVPGICLGILVAPPMQPMEIAMSIAYGGDANLDGDAALQATRITDYPSPSTVDPSSATALATPLVLRAGLRYLGDRLYVEANGELYLYRDRDPQSWTLAGLSIHDETGLVADLERLPTLFDQRSHAAARLAVDLEVVRGFLWLTAGYAHRSAATHSDRVTGAYGDLGGHTVAIGAEGQWSSMTMTIGFARTLATAIDTTWSSLLLVNPFAGGTTTIGNGHYQRAHDAFGAQLEVAWD